MKDYIILGGRKVRVEFNWNAIVAFFQETGRDDMSALANFGKLKPSDMAALIAAGVNEGERLEGRESALTAQEVGGLSGVSTITEVLDIYIRQTMKAGQKEEPSDPNV